MKMNHKTKLLALAGIILALASAGAWATSAAIVWNPDRLAPASVAPEESLSATVVFTNKGPSTINGAKLSLEVRGDAKTFVSLTQPNFPQVIKKGESVPVNLSIHSPSDQAVRVVTGTLALVESKPNGTTKDVFRSVLPLEITLSPFFLPPAPDKALDESTVEGVDTNGNGVRDRTERYIGFTYPNSEKLRMGLMQDARVEEMVLRDSNSKEATRAHRQEISDAIDCVAYLFNHDWNAIDKAIGELTANFILDTTLRIRADHNANAQFGGMVGSAALPKEQRKIRCSFDPDTLPN
jgi:hypothetical protein